MKISLLTGINISEPNKVVNDTLIFMIYSFILFFPISYMIMLFTPSYIYTKEITLFTLFNTEIIFYIPSIICTIIYGIVFYNIWYNDLKKGNRCGLVSFIVSCLFAVAFATSIDVAFNPVSSVIQYKYSFYIKYSLQYISQVSLVAILPIVESIGKYSYMIFKNNLIYSIKSIFAGLIGGFFGFVIMGLISVFSTGFIWGCTVGILIRNGLAKGYNPLIIPISSYLSALGLPPFWHTFWEFFAFGTFGVFGSLLTYGLIFNNEKFLRTSISCSMLGIIILMIASFSEVTTDASFIKLVSKYVDFSPQIANITLNINYFMTLIISLIVVFMFMVLASYMINLLLFYIRESLNS